MEKMKEAHRTADHESLVYGDGGIGQEWTTSVVWAPLDTAADMAAAMRGATGYEPEKGAVTIEDVPKVRLEVKLPTFQRDRAVRTIAQCAGLNGADII